MSNNFEDDIRKAINERFAAINQNFILTDEDLFDGDDLEKAKQLPIGTIRTHGGFKRIKTAQGWRPYSEGKHGPTEKVRDMKTGKEREATSASLDERDRQMTFRQILADPKLKKLVEGYEYVMPDARAGDHEKIKLANQYADELQRKTGYDLRQGEEIFKRPESAKKHGGAAADNRRAAAAHNQAYQSNHPRYAGKRVEDMSHEELVKHRATLLRMESSGHLNNPDAKALDAIEQRLAEAAASKKPIEQTKATPSQTTNKHQAVLDAIKKHGGQDAHDAAQEFHDPAFASEMDDSDVRGVVSGLIDEGYMTKSEGARALHEAGHKKSHIAKDLGMHYSHVHQATKGSSQPKSDGPTSKTTAKSEQKFHSFDWKNDTEGANALEAAAKHLGGHVYDDGDWMVISPNPLSKKAAESIITNMNEGEHAMLVPLMDGAETIFEEGTRALQTVFGKKAVRDNSKEESDTYGWYTNPSAVKKNTAKVSDTAKGGFEFTHSGKDWSVNGVPILYSSHEGSLTIGNIKLQGVTYLNVWNQFKRKFATGDSWVNIDAEMQDSRGPIAGESRGRTWNEIKSALQQVKKSR